MVTRLRNESSLVDAGAAARRIRNWGEAREWCGWDPYDALNSPAAHVLTLGTSLGRRLMLQAVKLSPFNLRPVLGIRPERNHKAIGLVASAYTSLAAAGDESASAHATRWLDWLERRHVGGEAGYAWAYHFDVQTRFFAYPAGSPNTIATVFVAHAFLDAAERLSDSGRIEPAVRAAEFLVDRMLVDADHGLYFRYIPDDDKVIHNCNLLACATLARASALAGRPDLQEIAARGVATSLQAQRPDGSWPYSDWYGQSWVDNFHTGYVLESLAACTSFQDVRDALERGVAFWQHRLFLPDGTPKYFPDRAGPRDSHCYAQAIDTWLALNEIGLGDLDHAEQVAFLLIRDMLRGNGSVIFQRRGLYASRVSYVRWSAAPAFRALARLALAQGRASN